MIYKSCVTFVETTYWELDTMKNCFTWNFEHLLVVSVLFWLLMRMAWATEWGGGFGGGLALLEFESWCFLINIFCRNKFSLIFELLKLNSTTVSPVEKFFCPPPVVDGICSCCFYRHNELCAWAWSSEGKQTETLQFDMCRTWIIQAMKWNNSAFVSTFSNRLQSVKSSIRYFVEIVACTHAHDITVAVMQQFRPFRLSWLCARSTQMFSGSYVMKKWRGV